MTTGCLMAGEIQLLHGDSLALLPGVGDGYDLAYLDPPWPGTVTTFGVTDHAALLRATCEALPASVERLVLHMGCDTDPRFIVAIPTGWPFLRVLWLRFARPSYKGRLLNGAEVAYVFGRWPESRPGTRVMPGETAVEGEFVDTSNRHDREAAAPAGSHRARRWEKGHPCPRRINHLVWLLRWWCRRGVIDPFAGSGTTLLAAQRLGLNAVGIERDADYVKIARRRLTADEPLLRRETKEATP